MGGHAGESFGRNLMALAAARGVRQGQLGAAVGFGKSKMSMIVTGQQEPKVGDAAALAAALGVSLADLLGEPPAGGAAPVLLTAGERDLVMIARRIGVAVATDRALGVIPAPACQRPAFFLAYHQVGSTQPAAAAVATASPAASVTR